MSDIAVIILTKDEKLHIGRCLERLKPLEPKQIFMVDCLSTDGCLEIARETAAKLGLNLEIVQHAWPGNQAAQFNWFLDNHAIDASWILRLDADEYLYADTTEELKELVMSDGLPSDVTSLSLSRARRFEGCDIRHGTHDIVLVRAFRNGFGRSTVAEMDEQIVTTSGRNHKLRGKFVDDSLMPFHLWKEKHRNYAKREARMAIQGCANKNKRIYYKLPPYLRALAYFGVRYFLRGGFLDGRAGWKWNFWQGLWYRWIVDREIGRMRNATEIKT